MCHFFVALNSSIFLMVHLKLLLVKRNAFLRLCLAMEGMVVAPFTIMAMPNNRFLRVNGTSGRS